MTNSTQTKLITAKDLDKITQIADKTAFDRPFIAVYCGAKMGNDPIYQQMAYQLGQNLANNGFNLVYGGASIGLMGAVADGVLSQGGEAVGVIPNFMLEYEIAHQNLTRLHLTDSMHTRKTLMEYYASAFITLPGGLGTLEEIMEVATWGQLKQHNKPMILLNVNNFYEYLISHLKLIRNQGFTKKEDLRNLLIADGVEQAVDFLIQNRQHF